MPQKDKDFVSLQKFNGLLTMILLYKLLWPKLNADKLMTAIAFIIFGIATAGAQITQQQLQTASDKQLSNINLIFSVGLSLSNTPAKQH